MVIKPIKGGFRVWNVGFHYDGIMVLWRKNIHPLHPIPISFLFSYILDNLCINEPPVR